MAATTIPCETCKGFGLVPHERRMIGEGDARKPDPLDFQRHRVCDRCAGAGALPYKPPRNIEEKKPGFVADQIGDLE